MNTPTKNDQAREIERMAETIIERLIPRDLHGKRIADSYHDGRMTISRAVSGIKVLVRVRDEVTTVFETSARYTRTFRTGFWLQYIDTLHTAALNAEQYRPMAQSASINFLPVDDAEAFMPEPPYNDDDNTMTLAPHIRAAICAEFPGSFEEDRMAA